MQRTGVAALIALVLGCAAGGGDEPSPTVARNGDLVVTLEELDDWVKESLFRERTDGGEAARIYELRARALDGLIEQRVIDREAKLRNTSVEALLASTRGEIPPAEIQAFYDENRERLGEHELASLEPRIRQHLEEQNEREAITAWVQAADVKILLEPPRFEVAAVGPARGPAEATVTIIEFSDFQCPFCRRAGPILDAVLERYPDDVRLVYRHLPLDSIHARARPAAEAATCAEDQGLFWEFHDAIFAGPSPLSDADLRGFAEQIGADLALFDACVESGRNAERVVADTEAARAAGITGTPAFFVNGVLLSGAQPAAAFERIIDHEIAVGNASP